MARLYLARHGRAAAGFGEDHDPGLDDLGRAQARDLTDQLDALGPMPVVVSPLRRTRETAEPLLARWGVDPIIDPRVAEIPSPSDDLAERAAWLHDAMSGGWSDLEATQQEWRAGLVAALLAIDTDTVVVTHFIAINAALGHATRDDRVVVEIVGNCSCTVIDNTGGDLRVVDLGGTAVTIVG